MPDEEHPHSLVGADALDLLDELSHLDWRHIRSLALSVGGLEDIDASGISTLVRIYSHLDRAHLPFCICHATPKLRARLHALGLDEAIPVVDDPPEGAFVEPWDLES